MTQDEIMEMWNSITKYAPSEVRIAEFAKLVAKHTLSNIDPSKFMSWQEAFEVGAQKEREACAKLADDYATWGGSSFYYWLKKLATEIRARGEA